MIFSFIHVNFNSSEQTINCIESILNCEKKSIIIIVDNNSIPSEKAKIILWNNNNNNNNNRYEGAIIHFIFQTSNIGYFGAINSGLNYIKTNNLLTEFVIIGNNDLIFENSFFEELKNSNFGRKIFVLAPNIIKASGIHQNPFALKKTTFTRKLLHRIFYSHYFIAKIILFISSILNIGKSSQNRKGFEISQIIFAGHGSCYVLTKSYFTSNLYLDDKSFLMGEEYIFAKQIRNSGGHIFYLSSLIVRHDEHSSIKKMPSKTIYIYMQKAYRIIKKIY